MGAFGFIQVVVSQKCHYLSLGRSEEADFHLVHSGDSDEPVIEKWELLVLFKGSFHKSAIISV